MYKINIVFSLVICGIVWIPGYSVLPILKNTKFYIDGSVYVFCLLIIKLLFLDITIILKSSNSLYEFTAVVLHLKKFTKPCIFSIYYTKIFTFR